jgi:transcriptional regulator with XRE-family HTH domain
MPAQKFLDPGSSPAALWGSELRHYRQAAGLSQPELAQRIYCSRQLVGAMETGERPPEPDRARLCDEALRTGGALRRLLKKLRLDAFPAWFREWPTIEEQAVTMRGYSAMVVPGLLQTADYARGLLTEEAAVKARMERQAVLAREDPQPPTLRYIMDEGVLRREVGGPAVMRAQLEHLVSVASSRVTVQIVPMGVHAGLSGNFFIATLESGDSMAYVDTAARGFVLDRPEDIAALAEVFESLRSDALPKRQSLEVIRRAAEQWT